MTVELVRLGTDYGGWWVPRDAVYPGMLAYCAGAGEDISFELALHEAGCRVVTFDPTPRSIEYVKETGPHDERFRFVPIGWWDEDTELRFFSPRDASDVSHSVLNLQHTAEYFVSPVKPVWKLMRELGDETVDLIKMDIEGAEYRVIRSLLAHGPRPSVLCVELHAASALREKLVLLRLRLAGYSLAKIDGTDYTFVRRRRGENARIR
ncbi:MAG TPA: FkbM family methyltransferase [Gaiellaceae bacterium]|nr:FkbM family methyltransferase [Gaiellaceae bacterium]